MADEDVRDEQKDFQQAKIVNILGFMSDKDIVVTAGNPVFERYLRYHYSGDVIYFSIHRWISGYRLIHKAEGCTYILGVFNIHRSLRIRLKTDAINKFTDGCASEQPIINDNFGIYLEIE